MSVNLITSSMRSRIPWDVAKVIFQSAEIPVSHGWDKTLNKFRSMPRLMDEKADELEAYLREHLLCGEKQSRLYRLSPEAIAHLRSHLNNIRIDDSEYRDCYPSLLSSEALRTLRITAPTLVAVEHREAGIAAVFASIRHLSIREDIDRSTLDDEAADALSDYDELVGIKHTRVQAIDVVWVPYDGDIVDVRIDSPKGMTVDQGGFAHERLRDVLSQLVGVDYLTQPINLFPLVDRVYRSRAEGVVVELAFGTTTASLKHEKMRRKGLCLRDERYHRGGTSALTTPIQPYRLSVRWEVVHDNGSATNPELSVAGNARMTGQVNAAISDVVIRRCVGHKDYDFVISRVKHYIELLAAENDEEGAQEVA